MKKLRLLHWFKLAIAAFFLLNFSTICVYCFFSIFGPIFGGGGFFQAFIWGMMLKDISSNHVIIIIRIFLFISSVFFWFKKPNWITASYLIIAGTGAGLLSVYFFAFYQLSIIGCVATIAFCFFVDKIWQFIKNICNNVEFHPLLKVWCKFWTPTRIGVCSVIFAAILIERFIPWEFPIFGKPQPYVITGYGYSVGLPNEPNEYDISIAVDSLAASGRSANIAATCAAAARYLLEQYGFSALTVNVYSYFGKANKQDKCYYQLGRCRYSPTGFSLHKEDKNLKPGWSHFQVARDFPEKAILECNDLVAQGLSPIKDDDQIRKQMGYWAYSKLEPDFLEVAYGLLPAELCERPSRGKNWHFPLSRRELVEGCESLYQELKAIGEKQDFPDCYMHGCSNRRYIAWTRQRYNFWKQREGNFVSEIQTFNIQIDALAKAYSTHDNEMINALSAKIEKTISDLKGVIPCGGD